MPHHVQASTSVDSRDRFAGICLQRTDALGPGPGLLAGGAPAIFRSGNIQNGGFALEPERGDGQSALRVDNVDSGRLKSSRYRIARHQRNALGGTPATLLAGSRPCGDAQLSGALGHHQQRLAPRITGQYPAGGEAKGALQRSQGDSRGGDDPLIVDTALEERQPRLSAGLKQSDRTTLHGSEMWPRRIR